jgi:bifunctional non-homologous end joining protein LigD
MMCIPRSILLDQDIKGSAYKSDVQALFPMSRSANRTPTAVALLPDWIRPQLTQLVDAAPDGDRWLHEIKYDGFRMHARLDQGEVRLLTRNGLNWTAKYPQTPGR